MKNHPSLPPDFASALGPRVQPSIPSRKPTRTVRPERVAAIVWRAVKLAGLAAVVALGLVLDNAAANSRTDADQEEVYLSPTALALSPDGRVAYVACAGARQAAFIETSTFQTLRIVSLTATPSGLALTPDGRTLYVTCAAPESTVCVVDTEQAKVVGAIAAGHTAMAPVLSPDGKTLYVCNRFNNEVAFIELASRQIVKRARVPREPVAADITPDGKFLLAANHIHAGRSDADVVAASVSVIDTALGRAVREIALPNGSGLLRDVRISPDGHHAVVTHLLSRFHLPTTQVDRGWVNTSALSLIDLRELRLINTVLLDNIDAGAANPWSAAWSADGQTVCVTHAGTHELSVVNFPALLSKLAQLPARPDPNKPTDYLAASRSAADVPNDLTFLIGLRRRVPLSGADRGPRAVAVTGTKAFLANYFSDTLSVVDLSRPTLCAESVPLKNPREARQFKAAPEFVSTAPHPNLAAPAVAPSRNALVRRGELLFNDATICFQGWQSCASCHSSDARVDGLNWDNLNDGIGNPKNAKSLLFAHRTSPSMWLGVRSNAEVAVRAGIRNSMFTVRPEDDAVAIDEYLKSLQPIPSPHRVNEQFSAAAERGKKLFHDETVGCSDCHKGELYTDRKLHDVGTIGRFDKASDHFDTPSLIEAWRTAPYLHDGRAATLREVLTGCNRADQHGKTSHLSPQEIDDLAEFVLSL